MGKPEEIQEEKVEVAKDVRIDERDTSTRDTKKIDSADLPELETVLMPQEKEKVKSEAPVAPQEKPKEEPTVIIQSKKEESPAKKQDAPIKKAEVVEKQKIELVKDKKDADIKQVTKEKSPAKKQEVPVQKVEAVEQPK